MERILRNVWYLGGSNVIKKIITRDKERQESQRRKCDGGSKGWSDVKEGTIN